MQPRGLFSKERAREITPEDIETTERTLRSYAAETLRGNPRALPLQIREAIQALVVEPAVEAIITDERGRYALVHRPLNDSPANKRAYGTGKLGISGGFAKPNREGAERVSPIGTAIRVAKETTGLDIVPISGPIAMYQWTRTKEHPTGWPLSLALVCKVVGGTQKEGVQWFDPDTLPPDDEMIDGNSGEIHRAFIRAYQAWRANPTSFIDLNAESGDHAPVPDRE